MRIAGALIVEWDGAREEDVVVDGERFAARGVTEVQRVDATGYVLFPGFVNAHDHLPVSWLPAVGAPPYPSVYAWMDDQTRSDARLAAGEVPEPDDPFFAEWERRKIPRRDRYLLGAYKQALNGVTTVADFVPNVVRERVVPTLPELPVELLADYRCERGLRAVFNRGIVEEHADAGGRLPFFVHAAEGVDEASHREVTELDALGVLGANSVFVHAVALSEQQIARLAATQTSVAWCPHDHLFLYGATSPIPALLAAGVNVAVGTDSLMTGAMGLLEEVRVGRRAVLEAYGARLDAPTLLRIMTQNGARALGLASRKGRIAPGYDADFVLMRQEPGSDPIERLMQAQPEDLALVVSRGRPVFGDTVFAELFETSGAPWSRARVRGVEKLLFGDPVALLERCYEAIGYRKPLPFIPVEALN